jgi:CBS domain-containing protein
MTEVRRRRTTVADVMTTTVASVSSSTPIPDVASTLFTAAVRAVPVLDPDGALLGVISEADLLPVVAATEQSGRRWWRPRHIHHGVPAPRPGARTAGELMSAVPITIGPDATVAAAARLMRERGVSWLPVLAGARLVGVLGRSDLLTVFLRPDAEIRSEVIYDVLSGTLMVAPGRVRVDVADGVVTLTGELDTHVDAEVAAAMVHRIEGVVDVVADLGPPGDDPGA